VKVDHVDTVRYSPYLSQKRIDSFKDKAREHNKLYYSTKSEILEEVALRQIAKFGHPLDLEMSYLPASQGEYTAIEEGEDDGFN